MKAECQQVGWGRHAGRLLVIIEVCFNWQGSAIGQRCGLPWPRTSQELPVFYAWDVTHWPGRGRPCHEQAGQVPSEAHAGCGLSPAG